MRSHLPFCSLKAQPCLRREAYSTILQTYNHKFHQAFNKPCVPKTYYIIEIKLIKFDSIEKGLKVYTMVVLGMDPLMVTTFS